MQSVGNIVIETLQEAVAPEPTYTVTEWSDRYRILPKKSSSEAGKYRSSRTPYMVEIMDCLSVTSPVQDVCFTKATQIGGTEAGINWFGYVTDASPGPMLMILPTDDLAKKHSKQKLADTIDETARLRKKIRTGRARGQGNTLLIKEFPGGMLFMSGANSPANFRQLTIRYLFMDDIDAFPIDVGEEGDPVDLANKRTDTYSYRKKIYLVSTPTVKDASRIEAAFLASDQRYYRVPCPHCGEKQVLEWGGKGFEYGIKFERDEGGNVIYAWYQCKFCKDIIEERHKNWMLENGEWVPTYPERKKRGYHLSGFYSPLGWVSWKQICQEFIEAQNNREKLKVWNNTRLAKTFEEPGLKLEWTFLKSRAEPYLMLEVPEGGLVLTSGVDTQDNRLAVSIYAWGRGEESWLIYHNELWGDPAQQAVWDQLDVLLNRSYKHASGIVLHVLSMAVDTQGHRTQAVYNYCRTHMPRVIAIQGASRPNKPVLSTAPSLQDVDYEGIKIKGGVQLWTVGSDTAKGTIYSRLNTIEKPGPGYIHFPIGLDDEFYLQMTAEKQQTRYVRGFSILEWVKTRDRNEALDCSLYAYAAAIRAGIAFMDWDKLEMDIKSGPKTVQKPAPKDAGETWLRQRAGGFERPSWMDRK